ncbi:MAG: T9SS type A sorting domain-containing protein [Flavobacteriales bacterium]|nr:T9SS type A sorting domain-containing protein [Flavobacteriales bacterium]
MKMKKTLVALFILVGSGTLVMQNLSTVDEVAQYTPRVQHFDQTYYNNLHGIAGAMEYYIERRKNVQTGKIEIADMLKADRAVANFGKASKLANTQASLGLNWIEMGPDNVGGRTRGLIVDKFNSSKLYAGGVGGGLFISYTAGLVWSPVNDKMNSLAIGCICQSKDGDIYVGTGESFVGTSGQGTVGTPGLLGRGIFKKLVNETTFDSLPSTVPTNTNSSGSAWAFVNRCATDPFDNDLIYAATNNGLHYSNDGGTSWTNAICINCPTTPGSEIYNTGSFQDVKIGSNGVIVASNGGSTFLKKPDTSGFVSISSHFTGGSRFEFAIAPSNPDIIYVVAGSGGVMGGLWKTLDGGDSWVQEVPAGNAGVFNGQADYDMALAVFPDDPLHVIVGGVELWALDGTKNTWDLIALTQQFAQGLYVHADKHIVAFPPDYNTSKIFYIGGDGGVFAAFNGGQFYTERNSGYNVTQFYAMGVSREGWVAGGTQDNGNPFIDFSGNTIKSEVRNLPSGDGGYMQFSVINPSAFFWESQGGSANRSPEKGSGSSGFFHEDMCIGGCNEGTNEGPWVTPMVIWESFNDLASKDSVRFIAKQAHNAGATIVIESANDKFPFEYITPVPLSVNDTIMIQDIVQNKFLVGTYKGTWMCKNVLDFATDPAWYKISDLTGITSAAFSADGDIVYLGKATPGGSGSLNRVSGLLCLGPNDWTTDDPGNAVVPSCLSKASLFTASQYLTGIGVDPNNAENVVITLGSYGNTDHVYVSSNAASATGVGSFSSIQGDLPAMPCYDAIIEMGDSNTIIIGTDYGVWATDNAWGGNVTWTSENNSFPRTPVFMVIQKTMANSSCSGMSVEGNIYVATHGRGIWRSEDYKAPQDTTTCQLPIAVSVGSITGNFDMSLRLHPNPVADGSAMLTYTLNEFADVEVTLYDITGKRLKLIDLSKQSTGKHTMDLDCSALKAGTYFVSITANGIRKTERLVVL